MRINVKTGLIGAALLSAISMVALPAAADLHCGLAFMCCMSACEHNITTSV